jgi:hypothetical protein
MLKNKSDEDFIPLSLEDPEDEYNTDDDYVL